MSSENFLAIDQPDIIKKAIDHYGSDAQLLMAVEEMSELTQALCKDFREIDGARENIVEEMADVYIMLAQLEIIFSARNDMHKIIDQKLERLANRMETNQ